MTELIYSNTPGVMPELTLEVLRHVDLGDHTTCVHCRINGQEAKRLTQLIYGKPVNNTPVWSVNGRITAEWFASIMEDKYLNYMKGRAVVMERDAV